MRGSLRYVGLLFWLKSRLMWRNYTRNTSAAVGAVFLVLCFGPMSLGMAAALGAGFYYLEGDAPGHLLRGALLFIYAIWLLAPVFGYTLSEDYDLEKLLFYPISPRQLFAGVIAGSVMDFGVLLFVPALLVVLISFANGAAGLLLAALVLVIFLFHTVALSQALGLVSAGLLSSRRSREAMVIGMMLLSFTFYAVTQLGARHMASVDWGGLLHSAAWRLVGFTPPGLAASALSAVRRGDFGTAAALLLALLGLAALTLALAGRLVQLAYFGEGPSLRARRRRPPAPPVRPRTRPEAAPSWSARLLPPAVYAMARKDAELLTREPYLRMMLMQCGFGLLMGIVVTVRFASETSGADVMPWVAPLFMMMMQAAVVFNLFGVEGNAAFTLFLLPASRRHLLLGKNLTFFSVFALLDILAAIVVTALAGQVERWWALALWLVLLLGGQIAVGNLVSIWFPYRIVMRGWRVRPASASRQMTYSVVALLAQGVTVALLLPVLAAVLLPLYVIGPAWFLLTLPFGVAWVAALYLLSLWLSERALLAREMELTEQLMRVD